MHHAERLARDRVGARQGHATPTCRSSIVDTRLDAKAAADAGVQPKTFIGSDNYEGGKLAGEYVVKVDRRQGARRHPRRHSRPRDRRLAAARLPRRGRQVSPGITIVASQPANWERDQGFNVFQNMLQAHPDIDTVFAASDLMALGAIEAIAAAGKTGKIRVIGFDALDDAKKAIAAGTMEASVAQFPYEMGKVAVESAVKVIARREAAGRHHGQAGNGDEGHVDGTESRNAWRD